MIDWREIDTVLLDMDGTLLDLHFDNFFWLHHLPKRFGQAHGKSELEALEQLTKRFERERGSLNWYCLDYWTDQLGLDISLLKREVAHLIALRPHVEEFLGAIRQSGRQCWLVTNAHRDSVALKLERIALAGWLDRLVISHDFDAPKESEVFWQRLHAEAPFDPARTLLIDDTETVLNAAAGFGIRHLVTLIQPDSSKPVRVNLSYPSILHFDEIMPPASPATPPGEKSHE